MSADQQDRDLILNAILTTMNEANCPDIEHYAAAMLDALVDYKPAQLAVLDEFVPDPHNPRERLPHRVVRVLNREGDVRRSHTGAPMTVRALLAELWCDRAAHRRVGWRPYGAPLS